MAKTAVKKSPNKTTNEKGALSLSTSGKHSLDYFAKAGTYRGRSLNEVGSDLNNVWNEDPQTALAIMFYLRTVTRTARIMDGSITTTVQKGQGVKDEFIKACEWLDKNHPASLEKNLWLIPATGCWKDLWYDSASSGYSYYINPSAVYEVVARGLKDEYNRALIAKYLPRIRSNSNIKNDRHRRQNEWAKGLCKHLGWSPVEYRKFKSDPKNTAHLWQRLAAKGLWEDIDFSKMSGKALFTLVSAKGKDKKTAIERHKLEAKYDKWLDGQPTAKFTGYVYELYKAAVKGGTKIQVKTYDKQFDGLIDLAKKDTSGIKGNVWCALDTSGSMSSPVNGEYKPDSLMAIEVAVSLGIYFATLNEGNFKDHVIMFDNTSRVKKLTGTFSQKCTQVPRNAMGGTNFQSVVNEIVRIRKSNPAIPVSDYPTTLMVVSDMQFDSAGNKTNYEALQKKLADVGLPKLNMIWWYVTGRGKDVPNSFDDEGVTIISGFDPAAITLILGGDQEVVDKTTGEVRKLNAEENMQKALDQEIIKQLKA